MADYAGYCHCGNLEMTFRTGKPAEALAVRSCQCRFCRRHGARTLTDPDGSLTIRVHDAQRLERYRFGLETADFLLCRTCGVYLAAVFETEGLSYATLNTNCLSEPATGFAAAQPVSYDQESEGDRIRRRKANWTPLVAFMVGGETEQPHPSQPQPAAHHT